MIIPSNIWTEIYSRFTVSIAYQAGNQAVTALAFSVDYEQECLLFDATDQNGDGVPDNIISHLPSNYTLFVDFDPADIDGELDFTVFNATASVTALPALEPLLEIEFATQSCVYTGHYRVVSINFSTVPAASFGSSDGQAVAGRTVNGSVNVVYPTPTVTPTTYPCGFAGMAAQAPKHMAAPDCTVTASPTPSVTPTPSPSPTATGSPTVTTTPTNCPLPPPCPLLVAPVTSPTNALSQTISVHHYSYNLEWVEISTELGTFRATSTFHAIPITLLPNTVYTWMHLTMI